MKILWLPLLKREEINLGHANWITYFILIFFSNLFLKIVVPGYIPMSLFISAVVVTAWLCGTKAALLTVLLGAVAEILFFTPVHIYDMNKL